MSDEALRDVELCADELLTNAIEHTKAQCRVTVRWTGVRLRIEVADTSLHLPDPETARDTVTGGRGLLLVEGLAHSWGWYPAAVGKVVWFEAAADQSATGDERLAVLVHAAQSRIDNPLRTVDQRATGLSDRTASKAAPARRTAG
jgi:hypothetical protein